MKWRNAAWPEGAAGGQPRAKRQGHILSCPCEAPFLYTFAAAVLSGEIWKSRPPAQEELPGLTIYVPTRGAAEALKLAFLSHASTRVTFLPRIRILGETDPAETFAAFGPKIASADFALDLLKRAVEIPAAFGELQRQLQIASLVLRAANAFKSAKVYPGEPLFIDISPANAFTIAGRIARLIDEAQGEGADLDLVKKLASGDVSGNEQLSLRLLRSVLKEWAAFKANSGKIDPEERRNSLMSLEAEFIRHSEAPVLVAGSTGSVAATFHLMEALLARKGNAIVLPGIDRHLEDESWACLGEHPEHPQHALQQLLARLGISRKDVRDLSVPRKERRVWRADFLSEAMRPAASVWRWREFLGSGSPLASAGEAELPIIEAANLQEEAEIIALILRGALETEGQTAALVTPDEKLTKRVKQELARWDLSEEATEDSASLFEARVAACAASGKAEGLVTLLKHAPGDSGARFRRFAELMDLGALRQMWRPSCFKDIPAALSRAAFAVSAGQSRHPAMKRVPEEEWEKARLFADEIVKAFAPLLESAPHSIPLAEWFSAHKEVLSKLADLGIEARSPDEQEQLSLLDQLASVECPDKLSLKLDEYAAFFAEVSNARETAAHAKPHPRLFLWTPLDARLLSADVIVLGGLNEGCWPRNAEPDPWLSSRDRAFIGLSPPERRIGQAAQDFVSLAASAARVYLTRSRTVNGSLARPSRWLSRIKIVASGCQQPSLFGNETPWAVWAQRRREPKNVTPAKSPEPRPPLEARPRRLSVTAMEAWFANPYAIYARHILGLESLRSINEGSDARDKGILVHAALHGFLERHKTSLPANVAERLVEELGRAADAAGFDLASAPFWRPRFERFARWFADTEKARREGVSSLRSEVSGKLTLSAPAGPFEITARADRIDILEDGSLRIYDFKTGANTAQQSMRRRAPQLSLEGLIAREGAFAGIPSACSDELTYIIATGGEPPGETRSLKGPLEEAVQSAYVGTLALIARFDDPATPYKYRARGIFKDKTEYDPYAHLARVREWRAEATGENGTDE